MNTLDFFVVGVGKAATTWLHESLSLHPQIFLPHSKETHFFCPSSCPKSRFSMGFNWYDDLFSSADKPIKGEISVDYSFYYNYSAEKIYKRFPDAKIVFLLRHPVDRCYSDYWMHRRNKKNYPSIYELGRDHSSVKRSFYYRQICGYLKFFPREQVGIYYYDDLLVDAAAFLKSIYGYLGADVNFKPYTLGEKIAATHIIENNFLNFFYRRVSSLTKYKWFLFLWRVLKRVVDVKSSFIYKGSISGYPEISRKERQYLLSVFSDENEKLFNLTGRRIQSWQE